MPTTDPNNVFARIVTRRDVELAVVQFLVSWVPTYIAEIERQGGLAARTVPIPPDPNLSYRGGLDFTTWDPTWSPTYIVNATPTGEPFRVGGEGAYLQEFTLHVAVNFQLSSMSLSLGVIEEDSARQYADMLGAAAWAAILQHGGLGKWPDGTSVSIRTWGTKFPTATFPFTDERTTVRSDFEVHAIVADVVTEAAGPRQPLLDPYAGPADLTEVTQIDINVTAVPN